MNPSDVGIEELRGAIVFLTVSLGLIIVGASLIIHAGLSAIASAIRRDQTGAVTERAAPYSRPVRDPQAV